MAFGVGPIRSSEQQQRLFSDIYDAALDERRWPHLIGEIARSFNAEQGILRIMDSRFDAVQQVYSHNKDPKWIRPFNQYYKKIDPWLKMARPRDDFQACTHHVLPDKEYKKLEFYADFVAPQNMHFGMGGFLHASKQRKCYLSFQRPFRCSGFEMENFQLFKSMTLHVKKSLLINERAMDLDFQNSLLRDSLDQCNSPLLLVKKNGEIIFMNSQAENLIEQQPGISVRRGFISVLPNEANSELKKLIHQASDLKARTGFKQGGGMCFTDANKQVALSIMVAPVNPDRVNCDVNSSEFALLLLSTNKPQEAISVEMLISLYGFTQAEARLVEPLCHGLTLDQIADKFDLSKNTLRTQLRACFRKTGVARQSDLINLVKSGPVGNFSLRN